MTSLTESVVEEATLAWLESLGYAIKHGPEIAPGELAAERDSYVQVVLEERLRQALVHLNPDLPHEAVEDASRQLTLAARRDTLLPKLISGELRVNDANRLLARKGASA
jgi:type I restriction enzyme R subunit